MRAARYYGKEDIRIEEIHEPEVKANQVKISPSFVGICGTDLHEYLGGPNFCPVNAHPVTEDKIPVTLGHEFSGIITEVGSEVTNLSVGQACAVQPTIFCGHCSACDAGSQNVCHAGGFVGLSGGGGGLSGAVCVSASHVFPLPDGVALDTGALVEPLAVAWHAVSAAPELNSESVVLIIGGGPIGLAAILCLKAKGVGTIVVSEVASSRQEFAASFGATVVVNPIKDNVTQTMLDVSGGRGADVTFDCAGVPASIKSACEAVKVKGTVVNVAIWEKEIPFNPNWITFKESSYKSVLGYQREDFEAVIENLRLGKLLPPIGKEKDADMVLEKGVIKPNNMITRKIKLDNLVKDGIKSLIVDKDNQVKILVDMHASD